MTVTKRRRLFVAVAGLVVVALAASVVWYRTRPRPAVEPAGPPPDPRLTFPTPYRNVRPEVRYVGSAACAGCHSDIAASYHRHPMGRSMPSAAELVANLIGLLPSGQEPLPAASALASRLARLERYDAGAHARFEAFGREYQVEPRGSQIIHRETLYDAQHHIVAALAEPVSVAIGSGARTRSYLMARGDAVVESPLTWYVPEKRWDLSPGYRDNALFFEHFERPVTNECLYCHADAVEPVKGSANRYRLPLVREHGIGCERCHGPGQLHVEAPGRGADGLNPTIVNPARLEPQLRDSVCEQCHLQGWFRVLRAGREWSDYRPGLPFEQFYVVFDRPQELTDQHESIRTVEQMHVSRCYQKSRGVLGCISCHDPHELPAPETKAAYYRERCLRCHGTRRGSPDGARRGSPDGARRGSPDPAASAHAPPRNVPAPSCTEARAVRQRKGDSCIACHMAPLASSNIPHIANTDHRILRRTGATDAGPSRARDPARQPLLVPFKEPAADDPGRERDLGIALAMLAVQGQSQEAARAALPLLEAALHSRAEDLPALKARGAALAVLGRLDDAAAVFDDLVVRAPEQEEYLLGAAELAERKDQHDKAADYYRRALAINPHQANSHAQLAAVYVHDRAWPAAAEQLQAALRLNPFDLPARRALLLCYVRMRQRRQAQAELERVLQFKPPDGKALREWFEHELPD
jgi:predicted CXXCH cytochrome family protein